MKGSTFNQLMMFHAIANEGSITRAAQKLEVASPSVSNALKGLEDHLGLPLFTRTTRRIELTEAGRQLYENTADSIADLNYALESVSDLSKVPSGKVRLTLPRFVFQHFVKPVYAEFCHRYPGIQLEISVSDAVVDILKEGFDLGIRFGDRIEEGMIARPLIPVMRDAFFVSPDYADRYGLPQTPEDLKQHKLIQYRFIASNQLAPMVLEKDGEQISVDMPQALIVNDTDLVVDAAIKGIGIGGLVESIVGDLLDGETLIPILEDYWRPVAGLYVYFHKNTQRAKRVRVLIDFLLEKFPVQQ